MKSKKTIPKKSNSKKPNKVKKQYTKKKSRKQLRKMTKKYAGMKGSAKGGELAAQEKEVEEKKLQETLDNNDNALLKKLDAPVSSADGPETNKAAGPEDPSISDEALEKKLNLSQDEQLSGLQEAFEKTPTALKMNNSGDYKKLLNQM